MSVPLRSDTAPEPGIAPEETLLGLLLQDEVPDVPADVPPVPAPESETVSDEPVTDAPGEEPAEEIPETPGLEVVVVDGEELKVSKEELKAGYSRTADYTRKTQKLAEERKALEAKEREAREAVERYVPKLRAAEEFLAAQVGPEPDWAKLRNELPDAEFAREVADHQLRERKLAAARAERDKAETELQKQWEADRRKQLVAEQELLLTVIPEWKDASKAEAEMRALADYGKRTYGMSEQELSGITDHRAVVLLRKAKAYDDLMAAKPKLVPKTAPAMAKPGVVAPKVKVKAWEAARERLRQTGSPRDAEAMFLAAITDGEDF